VEESLVLARPTTGTSGLQSPVSVRVIDSGEAALWAQTAARGWSSESAELARFVEDIGSVIAQSHGVTCFLAELEGQPIAAAALTFSEGIGLLAGASTIPSARNQGAQQSLLKARLDFAAVRGIELAMVVTHPESAARRNSERQGFRPAYTRSKWQLKTGKAQRER
jgi:GNAT superfamily N-acetyltransferase